MQPRRESCVCYDVRVGIELPPRVKRLLPHFVAAFLVFHVTAMLIEVIPDLRMGMDRKAWKEPRIKHELQRWAERSEEHTSELQSRLHLVCRLLLEKKKKQK